jgi:DNA-directed RNA polymerase subunit RPC12/RpoP
MSLVTIKTFDNPYEIHVVKTKLESENIVCYVFDDNVVGLNPLYNISVGGVKLKVNSADVKRANIIIEEFFLTALTDDDGKIIKCPQCNSEKIYSSFKSMKSSKGIISAIVSFLLMIFPIYFDTVYKCKDCDYEFKDI